MEAARKRFDEALRVTFDLSKYRLMDSMDVVAGLDSRPVLVDLSPTEFEHLVRQLFEAIGLDSVNTRPSQDEDVDAVAMNTDPVMRGLCIIQAKRTAKVVPFESMSSRARFLPSVGPADDVPMA